MRDLSAPLGGGGTLNSDAFNPLFASHLDWLQLEQLHVMYAVPSILLLIQVDQWAWKQ